MNALKRRTTRTTARRLLPVVGALVMAVAIAQAVHVTATMPATTQKPALDIAFTTRPTPPKVGENTFDVVVKDGGGKAVTDADVTIQLYMGPTNNMPEMKNTVTVKHQKEGRYSGTGFVMMAGSWDVTVVVKRDGKDVGSKAFRLTAG